MITAIYPGTYDPVTNGHLDIIERTSRYFDEVIVAVIRNPQKSEALFTLDEMRFGDTQTRGQLTRGPQSHCHGRASDYHLSGFDRWREGFNREWTRRRSSFDHAQDRCAPLRNTAEPVGIGMS